MNIEEQIKKLYREYMTPQETIIINVSSVMVDLDTSASLQLSKSLDFQGERSVLCLTKMDQHKEEGLKETINSYLREYNIERENFFMIRNRTAKELK